MGNDEGRPDKAPRPVLDSAGLRERHVSADANLRRQREPEVASPRGWPHPARADTGLHRLEVPRAARRHRREVRLQRREPEMASLQLQSLVLDNGPCQRDTHLNHVYFKCDSLYM